MPRARSTIRPPDILLATKPAILIIGSFHAVRADQLRPSPRQWPARAGTNRRHRGNREPERDCQRLSTPHEPALGPVADSVTDLR
jgi:hypothetical protein